MGNMVLMAVRHKDLHDVAALKFRDSVHGQCNESDRLPKCFDADSIWNLNSKSFFGSTPNITVSHYYHSSDSPSLFVDDQMMCSIYHFYGVIKKSDIGPVLDFQSKLNDLRHSLRRYQKPKLSLVSGRGKVSRPVRCEGNQVSIFMILTDSMDVAEKNPHTMEDVARFCMTGEISERSFRRGMGISPICTLDENTSAIIRLSEYEATLFKLPRHDLQFSIEEVTGFKEAYEQRQWRECYDKFNLALLREISATFGYLLQPAAKKEKKP